MIRLNGTTTNRLRKPWRRRISNQFAVIAAIMLFASTQIGPPGAVNAGIDKAADVMARHVVTSDLSTTVESNTSMTSAAGDKSKTISTSGKKRKRLKLDLFLFRR